MSQKYLDHSPAKRVGRKPAKSRLRAGLPAPLRLDGVQGTSESKHYLVARLDGLAAAASRRLLLPRRFSFGINVAQIVWRVPILADRLEEFRIGHQLLHHTDSKWFRIRFRILDRDVNLQRAKVKARETFHHLPSACKRTPIHIQPDIITESHCRDH